MVEHSVVVRVVAGSIPVSRPTRYVPMENQINHPGLWKAVFPHRRPDSHKYDYGHAVITGAAEMTGATRLAAEACARIGAGLTTVIAPAGTGEIYRRTLAPHVIVEDRAGDLAAHLQDDRRNAVLVGPGAGKDYAAIRQDVRDACAGRACVLDADALNALAEQGDYSMLTPRCILTPHEGEFARLFPGINGSRIERARQAAQMTKTVIVLKGRETVIAGPAQIVINAGAPPWLATAGTGDVLAGMITGLLAQGMNPCDAACAAVWIHGRAAELFGEGLVASDITSKIPPILREIA